MLNFADYSGSADCVEFNDYAPNRDISPSLTNVFRTRRVRARSQTAHVLCLIHYASDAKRDQWSRLYKVINRGFKQYE
jgi:hypothetical protein